MNQTISRSACASILLAALAGCSSGPSESDIRAAMLKQAEASGIGLIAQNYKEQIDKVKLVGCAKADAGGYKCDIANAAGSVASARFVKASGVWAAVQER